MISHVGQGGHPRVCARVRALSSRYALRSRPLSGSPRNH